MRRNILFIFVCVAAAFLLFQLCIYAQPPGGEEAIGIIILLAPKAVLGLTGRTHPEKQADQEQVRTGSANKDVDVVF